MIEAFKSVSLSHSKASVEIREQMYLAENASRQLLNELKETLGIEEFCILAQIYAETRT